jgi:hypothetical protein
MADSTRTDEQIDAAIERSKAFESFPRIVEAVYRSEPGLEFLSLRLDDGRRLLVPREDLAKLNGATPAQAKDLFIIPQGRGIWWPQIDDGLYLPEFLEHRWRKESAESWMERSEVAA